MANEHETLQTEPMIITRTIDAPRELVWKALTDANKLVEWWGPAGMKVEIAALDLRLGGIFHYSLQAGTSPKMWGKFSYRALQPPAQMAFVNTFSDEAGGLTRHPLSPTWPLEVLNTWTLTDEGAQTKLNLEAVPINATPEEISTFNQWQGAVRQASELTFNQLDAYLKTLQ